MISTPGVNFMRQNLRVKLLRVEFLWTLIETFLHVFRMSVFFLSSFRSTLSHEIDLWITRHVLPMLPGTCSILLQIQNTPTFARLFRASSMTRCASTTARRRRSTPTRRRRRETQDNSVSDHFIELRIDELSPIYDHFSCMFISLAKLPSKARPRGSGFRVRQTVLPSPWNKGILRWFTSNPIGPT